MKTKAAVLRNIGGPLFIENLEIPRLMRGHVLVQILYSGVCRSNINEINGRKGANFIPHLTGHEASAIVVETGEGVTKVENGDYVVCSWIKGLGLEAPRVEYQSDKGVVNAGACSTFIEYAVISENRLIRIPKKVKQAEASLLGCAVPTGAGIVDHYKMKPGQTLAVFGIGGIGASALLRAVSLGINCTAFDIVPWKLKWAKETLGIEAVHSNEIIISKFGNLFDFAIECSGNKSAMENAFISIKVSGTAIIAGNLRSGETITIDPWQLMLGKTLDATWGGGSFLDNDIPVYVSEHLKGSLDIGKLITKVYKFDEINEAMADMEAGSLIRGIVRI